MGPHWLARLLAGRIHYGWIVVAVMFVVILATVGVRAAPGVLIVPLEQAFGWDATTISGAISLNILLGGLIGPFAAALLQTIGLRRTIVAALILLLIGAAGASFARAPWQLYAHLPAAARQPRLQSRLAKRPVGYSGSLAGADSPGPPDAG
jgi:cyanate permease